MKDFCKWLGVNEKIAKVVVWVFIFMISLIIINTALESIGLPFYKLTVANLSKVNCCEFITMLIEAASATFNWLSITLLVFPFKEIKRVMPWAILYLLILGVVNYAFNKAAVQIYILVFCLVFCYLFSGKKIKYLAYCLFSFFINTVVQYLCYLYKVRFVSNSALKGLNYLITFVDYLLIMSIILFIKEKVMKKKGVY